MPITLTLEGGHAGIVHGLLEAHYVEMCRVADRFEAEADPSNPTNARITATFRTEADECRQIGQLLEGLDPTLDPGDWRWPRDPDAAARSDVAWHNRHIMAALDIPDPLLFRRMFGGWIN